MTLPQPSDGFVWTQAPWGHVLKCRPLLEVAEHLFTTGNLELRGSQHEWDQIAAELGVSSARLLLVKQVHRAGAATARRGRTGDWGTPEADVIVSDDETSAIGVRVADCAPVLIADRQSCAVGAAHAGWRGTVQDAAGAAVRAMTREFGSDPDDLIAAIGPCLGPCCGEVGDEVAEAFAVARHDANRLARWFTRAPSGRLHVDLWTANSDQLIAAGLRPDRVHVARLCTKTHADLFHSFRAAGKDAGRMAGVITPRANP